MFILPSRKSDKQCTSLRSSARRRSSTPQQRDKVMGYLQKSLQWGG
jgi:hypothetical protein